MKGSCQVGFQVAEYDRGIPLIIDPVLEYSTYLGGADTEAGFDIALDAAGNIYIVGPTRSIDFPTTVNSFQPAHRGGGNDTFVAKLNAAGDALVYATYLGGSGYDVPWQMAVDAAGNAYLAGHTDGTDFPTTANAFQLTHAGRYRDAFLAKLDPNAHQQFILTDHSRIRSGQGPWNQPFRDPAERVGASGAVHPAGGPSFCPLNYLMTIRVRAGLLHLPRRQSRRQMLRHCG